MSITMGRCVLPNLLTVPLMGEPARMLKKQDKKSVGITACSFASTKHYSNSIKMKMKQGYGDVIKIQLCISICFIHKIRFSLCGITLLTAMKWLLH